MRILIDERRAMYAPYTGIGRFAGLIVRALEQYAPDVELVRATSVAGRFSASGLASSAWSRKLWADQVVIPFRTRGVDVCHALYHETSPFAPTPLVCSVHDLSLRTAAQHFSWAQRAYYGSLLPLLVRRARVVVVPSEATRADMEAAFPKTPVRIISYPVDPIFSGNVSSKEITSILGPLGLVDRSYLLYTGGLHARKDVTTLLLGAGLAQRRDQRIGPLVVTGGVTDAFRRQAAAAKCRITCPGNVADRVLRILYEGCALVVNASVNEGFGYPGAEAALAGKLIVAPDRGSLLEAAGRVGVAFRAGDPVALADAIALALTPNDRMIRACAQERARAVDRFSLRTVANQLLSCYEMASASS